MEAKNCRAHDNQPCISVEIDPPPAGLPASLQVIAQRFLLSDPDDPKRQHKNVRVLVASWLKTWQGIYQTPTQKRYGLGAPWSLKRKAKYFVVKAERPWGCLQLTEYAYSGGSHSQQKIASHLLDIHTGKKIVWQALLAKNITPTAFLTHIETLVDTAYPQRWKNEPLRLQHLVADSRGIGFWWHAYELGHYSLDKRGLPRVLVNWQKLEMWLDPKRLPHRSK